MPSSRVPQFKPSTHGFPFPNWFPPKTAVFSFPTPFGRLPIGDAHNGLCGGMIFTAMDCYHFGIPVPQSAEAKPVFQHFARRLLDSWNLPFGFFKYYDWQRRPTASRIVAGVRMSLGLTARTVEQEWPRIRAELDAGRLAALGLVKVHGWDVRKIAHNHQVLAYGYDLNGEDLKLHIYDPNWPADDDCTLALNLANADAGSEIMHSVEGPSVRGFFFTEYRKPAEAPRFCRRGVPPALR